jgi:hypothetical protein
MPLIAPKDAGGAGAPSAFILPIGRNLSNLNGKVGGVRWRGCVLAEKSAA